MKPKVYMSIPITGRDIEQVKKELLEVSKKIAEKGWEPVSPLDGIEDYTLPWEHYILRNLEVLRKCEGMIEIEPKKPSFSNGCIVEHYFARGCGIPIGIYNIICNKLFFIWDIEEDFITKLKSRQ